MYEEEQQQPYQQNTQKILFQTAENQIDTYPSQKICKFPDIHTSKMCYMLISEKHFVCQQFDYGNKFQKKQYNISKDIKRYFAKRYFFFSLFDDGIMLDRQSWYSVIPEPISLYLVQRLKKVNIQSVFQPFSGVGGLAVHFCQKFYPYWANDIDEAKISMLKNNVSIYGKGINKIKIMNKDFFEIKPNKFDAIVVCPPWGGINISAYSTQDLDSIMSPKLSDILLHCKKFSKNMILQMPKNTNIGNLLKIINMCFIAPLISIEKIFINGKISQLFIFIGSPKFTGISQKIYPKIIQDAYGVKNAINIKEAIKDLKQKIDDQKYEIFTHIYKISQSQSLHNKHIYFNE